VTSLPLLLRLTALSRLPRTGWLQAGVAHPESIADHSLGTALVALVLGPEIDPPLDVERAVALAVIHDAPEALLGDLPRRAAELLPPGAKAAAEERAAEELFAGAPAARSLWAEFHAGRTREARFARACDKLHLGLQLLAYRRAGNGELGGFRAGLESLDLLDLAPCHALRDELLEALDRDGADTLGGPRG